MLKNNTAMPEHTTDHL